MRRLIFAAPLVLAALGLAQTTDPETLLSTLLSRYEALKTFTATLTISLKFWEQEVSQHWKIWYSEPFARIEREAKEELNLPIIEIHDYGSQRRWLLIHPNYWEEEEIQTPSKPLALTLLNIDFVSTFRPSALREDVVNGTEVWVLEGPHEAWNATIFADKNTLFIVGAELRGKAMAMTVRIEEFAPNVELAQDLFQRPKPEEIAAIFRLSPEGMRIISEIQKKFGEMKSFVVRKSVEGVWGREEELVFWRYPFLRVERGSPPLWFLVDLSQGVMHSYYGEDWEKMELPVDISASPDFIPLFVLSFAFGLRPYMAITAISEETLGTKKVWRLTGRGVRGGPPPEWWVDQETLLVVQYTQPIPIKNVGEEEWKWEVEKVRIISFEADVEIPDDVFAVPAEVSVRELPRTEPETSEGEVELGPGLSWEPFSFARLEEASGAVTVLFFSADWCEPCHRLEEGPLRDVRVTELLKPLVRLKVDLSDPGNTESQRASEMFKVREIPTLIFLGPDGKELGRIRGFGSTSFLLAEIQRILSRGGG